MDQEYTDISHFRAPYKNWPYLGIGAATDPATPPPAAEVTPWYKNPLYIGGVLAVAAGAYFFMAKPTRSAAVANKRRRNARAKANAHKARKGYSKTMNKTERKIEEAILTARERRAELIWAQNAIYGAKPAYDAAIARLAALAKLDLKAAERLTFAIAMDSQVAEDEDEAWTDEYGRPRE